MLIYAEKRAEHKSHMPNTTSYLSSTWTPYQFLHTHMAALRSKDDALFNNNTSYDWWRIFQIVSLHLRQ